MWNQFDVRSVRRHLPCKENEEIAGLRINFFSMSGRNHVSREIAFFVEMYECKCCPLRKRIFPLRKRFVLADASKLAPARLESVL